MPSTPKLTSRLCKIALCARAKAVCSYMEINANTHDYYLPFSVVRGGGEHSATPGTFRVSRSSNKNDVTSGKKASSAAKSNFNMA